MMQFPSSSDHAAAVKGTRAGRSVRIGAITMNPLTFAEAIDAIEGLVRAGQGGMVFTPNVDHIVQAEDDARFVDAYRDADLSLVDGTPVLWASRLLGSPLPEKVSGADLLRPVVERGAKRGWRVYLLGAGPGVAERAKLILETTYPGAQIVGTSSPMVDPNEDVSAIADAVRATRPDVLFLALGAPKQELLAHKIRESVKPAVIICVGAAFDFVAGTARRAPEWISRTGFEWLYRLAQEPVRLWRRYLLRDPKFGAIIARQLRGR